MSRDYLIASSAVVGFAMVALAAYFGLAHREATSGHPAVVSTNALDGTKTPARTSATTPASSR